MFKIDKQHSKIATQKGHTNYINSTLPPCSHVTGLSFLTLLLHVHPREGPSTGLSLL